MKYSDGKKNKSGQTEKDRLLKAVVDDMELAEQAEAENRESFLASYRFSIGDEINNYQWDEAAYAERTRRGYERPCITINKTNPVVKQLVNQVKQNDVSTAIKPVGDGADPQIAQVYEGLIRGIEQNSNAESAYDTACNHAARGGWGYFRIVNDWPEHDAFDQEIFIRRVVNPLSVRFDPSAKEQDRSDAKWCYITDDMPLPDYEREYGDSNPTSDIIEGLGDKARDWISDKTVRVAEKYYIEYKDDTLFLLEDNRTIRLSDIEKQGQAIVTIEAGILLDLDDDGKGKKKKESEPAKISMGNEQPEPEELDRVAELADSMAEADLYLSLEDGKYLKAGDQMIPIKRERKTKTPVVMWLKTNGSEILEGPSRIPGRYIPVVPVLGDEEWLEGKQILRSAIHYAMEPNRLYNWARSTEVETMSKAPQQPYLLTNKQVEGLEPIWDNANRLPLPYLPYKYDAGAPPPMRQSGSTPDIGANTAAAMAADDIKSTTGVYDASLGAQGNETSGRAINARKLQSDTTNFNLVDNLVVAHKHKAKILIHMIPEVYDTERVVRLLDKKGGEAWQLINQTVVDPMTGRESVVHDISIGKYDAVVSAGPAYQTARQESADVIEGVIQSVPAYAPILTPRLIKLLDIQEADEIVDEIKQLQQGQNQPQQPSPEDQIDLINKQLTAEGKELMNAKRVQDLNQQQQQMEERTKELIIEALQGLGLVPQQ